MVQTALAIQYESVSKYYETDAEEIHALDTITLDIPKSEFLSIVGPSGCGKSTLMLCTAGLVPWSGGTVKINGKVASEPDPRLGIVFQDPVLVDWRDVIGNVLLQIDLRGLPRQKYMDRAKYLLNLVGLQEFESRRPYELSGGMQQRVALCRALVHSPNILLMDEPFGALDALTRDQLNLEFQAIWLESRPTVLFITHSIDEAVFLSDRVVVMSPRPGQIQRVIDIDLPRPRTLAARETTEFAKYTSGIRELFSSMGVLHDLGGEVKVQAREHGMSDSIRENIGEKGWTRISKSWP